MKESVWVEGVKINDFKSLEGDTKCDVLIIGGGICGVLCAFFLEKAGVDYILAEGGSIASGITKNTTAKITSQHGIIYSKLLKSEGKEKAQMYFAANRDAIKEYKSLCENINCDFEIKDAYTYTLSDRAKIEDEVKAAKSLGAEVEFTEKIQLPLDIKGAVKFKNQAQFHPLKFIAGISKGLKIYENTFVKEMIKNTAVTNRGKITAKKIIVATHFPFINKHGSYFLKLYQHRSYVCAYENAVKLDGMYVDEDLKGMSFRNYGELLLLGGGSHRTGKNGGNFKEIEKFSKKHYPDAKCWYMFATQDCMSLDSVPYIGRYSRNTPEMYVATGFNKWGMTSSVAAAKILCDMVLERKNDYAAVFSPQRNILKPQLLINGAEATLNLLTPSVKRCPHLGCALKWNKAEHSWDCPCHGSRFDKNGKLIDNPAIGNAKIRKY